MFKIGILDPSFIDKNNLSNNLGDLIIRDSINSILENTFNLDCQSFFRVSTHCNIDNDSIFELNRCDLVFVAGTNLLSSNVKLYSWQKNLNNFFYIFPKIKNISMFGVGWGVGYNRPLDFKSKLFYKSSLSKTGLQSVRDEYSKMKLEAFGIKNIINTTCPTLWSLNDFDNAIVTQKYCDCIFTLTDYGKKDFEYDSKLISFLLSRFSNDLYFFPQGKKDKENIQYLEIYKRNNKKIIILDHSIEEYNRFLTTLDNKTFYIGTRLHGAIRAMQYGVKSLIIGIDNRAKEMAVGTNLPVIDQHNFELIDQWLLGIHHFSPLNIPLEEVVRWKQQFE